MPDDARDEQTGPASEGFTANVLRESTITGSGDDPGPPPEEPQGAALPRRGAGDSGDRADDTDDSA